MAVSFFYCSHKRIYIDFMVNYTYVIHMKPLTLYVSDEVYSSYQEIALKLGVKTAALIRKAMNSYLSENLKKKKTLDDFVSFNSGDLKKDFIHESEGEDEDEDFRGEMLDDRY